MKLLQTGMAPNRPTTFDFPKKISRKRLCTSEGSARVPTPASKCQEVGVPKKSRQSSVGSRPPRLHTTSTPFGGTMWNECL